MNYRRVALAVGVAALGVGVVATVDPGLVALEVDRLLVSTVGVLALVQALRVVQSRRRGELDEAETPDPERSVATPPPGEDVETVLEPILGTRRIYSRRDRVREGLRSVGVAVLAQYGAYSEAEAREAIAAGTWTEDVDAAALLGDESAPTRPVQARVRNLVRRESSFRREVRHAVAAIGEVADVTVQSGRDGDEPPRRREPGREESPGDGGLLGRAGRRRGVRRRVRERSRP